MAKQGGQTPLYEQVVKMVKDQIVSGVYTKGDLLPSEKEMIDNFGVSRITVRKALSILSDMGYIRTEKGRGSEVILDVEDLLSRGKFSEEMTAYRRLCMDFVRAGDRKTGCDKGDRRAACISSHLGESYSDEKSNE